MIQIYLLFNDTIDKLYNDTINKSYNDTIISETIKHTTLHSNNDIDEFIIQ